MSDEEKFKFDIQGFIVIPDVLSHDECDHYSRLADETWPRQPSDPAFRRKDFISEWGQPFIDLMDHPVVLEYVVELVGRKVRIDHEYCLFMDKSDSKMQLHGGPRLFETDHWYYYQDGTMRNGLTVVTYNLTPSPEGAGGFTCIPGSHKSNFIRNLPDDVRDFRRSEPYVVQPALNRGDVLIFTEALIHGTAPWQLAHERRTLLYKYSPPHSSWSKLRYDPDKYPDLTNRQRRLMQPPSVEDHRRVVEKSLNPESGPIAE
ncbi:MAG TPA: hypothetical protein EYQ14_08610 [Gammaproteobacteria bacterium]|nr:hypothetical protein [Gammaproteobacteria bacterium]